MIAKNIHPSTTILQSYRPKAYTKSMLFIIKSANGQQKGTNNDGKMTSNFKDNLLCSEAYLTLFGGCTKLRPPPPPPRFIDIPQLWNLAELYLT